ncbi:WD40 repeat-like protein [Amanita rubescens]|nr:WD40 repeat-like protein [Amanita rubescens]
MADQIRVTADEINCLVYAFLIDSGFAHSAFTLRAEAQLDRSPLFHKHIIRGQLVELLCKALLYLEVEHHWKNSQVTLNCTAEFSLLDSHQCSTDAGAKMMSLSQLPVTQERAVYQNGVPTVSETVNKRKESPMALDEPSEKRAKRESEDMHADSSSESYKSKNQDAESTISRTMTPELLPRKSKRKEKHTQGPLDESTASAVTMLPGHTTEVFVCAWNPKNHPTLASGSKDAVVNFWTLPDPSSSTVPSTSDPFPPVSLHHFSKAGSADLTSLNWSPDGQLLAIGSYDSILRVSKPNGELYFTHSQHNGPIFATRFSKTGHWLLTASLDGTTCLWNVSEKRLQRQYHCHTDCCLDVAWLDDWTFASCGADSQIYIMQVDGGESIKTLSGHENEINEIRCNSTGTRLASCSDDTTARVWNIENISSSAESIPGLMASDVIVLRGHSHAVTTICWCPDHPPGTNQLIATSSFDGTARIWDSVTGECLKVLADHKRPLFSMTFSPNGKWLATGSGDGWLHIYSVESRLKRWSWYAGAEKPGVFEIDWQEHEGISRLAVALECRQVAVIDALAIPALRE